MIDLFVILVIIVVACAVLLHDVLNRGLYVTPPVGCRDYLIPGKVYKATNVTANSFSIVGRNNYCLFKDCAHLNGQDWIKL